MEVSVQCNEEESKPERQLDNVLEKRDAMTELQDTVHGQEGNNLNELITGNEQAASTKTSIDLNAMEDLISSTSKDALIQASSNASAATSLTAVTPLCSTDTSNEIPRKRALKTEDVISLLPMFENVQEARKKDGAAESLEQFKADVKKRRRSTIVGGSCEPDTGSRRKSGRMSMLPPPPVLSVADQIATVSGENVFCQLLDISIRDSLHQLCKQSPDLDLLSRLQGDVTLRSEQFAEEIAEQAAVEGITLQQLLPLTTTTSNSNQTVASIAASKDNKTSATRSTAASTVVQYKEKLIVAYKAEAERLHIEYKTWKALEKERKDIAVTAKREWSESRRGGNCLGEEQNELLRPAYRTYLADRPDYSRHLNSLTCATQKVLKNVAICEKAVRKLPENMVTCSAAADRAFCVADGAVSIGDLRSTLRDLHSYCTPLETLS